MRANSSGTKSNSNINLGVVGRSENRYEINEPFKKEFIHQEQITCYFFVPNWRKLSVIFFRQKVSITTKEYLRVHGAKRDKISEGTSFNMQYYADVISSMPSVLTPLQIVQRFPSEILPQSYVNRVKVFSYFCSRVKDDWDPVQNISGTSSVDFAAMDIHLW